MAARNANKRKADLLLALEKSAGLIATACKAANVSRPTYYKWYNEDAHFREKCDDIVEAQKDFAEAAILKGIKEGETSLIIFYAKTKMKDRGYVERQEIDANVRSYGDEIFQPKQHLTRDELIASGLDQETTDSLCDPVE